MESPRWRVDEGEYAVASPRWRVPERVEYTRASPRWRVPEHGESVMIASPRGESPRAWRVRDDCESPSVSSPRGESPRAWRVRDDCGSAMMLIALFLLASLSSWPGGPVAWRLQRWLSAWRSSWMIRGSVCESLSALLGHCEWLF